VSDTNHANESCKWVCTCAQQMGGCTCAQHRIVCIHSSVCMCMYIFTQVCVCACLIYQCFVRSQGFRCGIPCASIDTHHTLLSACLGVAVSLSAVDKLRSCFGYGAFINVCLCSNYGVATVSRLLEIIGFFCRI